MPLPEDLSPFSESTRRIARAWAENAVLKGRRSYKFVSPVGLGASGAEWRTDSDGNSVVVKRQEGKTGIAREKIAADLARLLGLPVPPARIWVKPVTLFGKNEYYAVSLKAFPKAQSGMPREVIETDPFLPAIGIFDTWILNQDRHSGNIVGEIYEGSGQANPKSASPRLAYIDHGLALASATFSIEKLMNLSMWGSSISRLPWTGKAYGLEQLEMPGSVTRTVLQRIQDMPDEVIAGVVNAVPDNIYSRKQKDETIRILCEGRDALQIAYPLLDFDAAEMTPERREQANLALREAMAAGDRNACRRVIKSGADIGAMDGDTWLAAVRHGDLFLLKFLDRLAEKTPPDYRPLFLCAAEHGHVESAEYLVNKILTADLWTLDQGFALFNATADGLVRDIEGASGMTPARRKSALRVIEQSEKRVRKEIQDLLDERSSVALFTTDLPSLRALVAAGADVHRNQQTLLVRAAERGKLDMVRYLVEETRADIVAYGQVAFFAARNHLPVAEYLAEKIFDPELWKGKTRKEIEAKKLLLLTLWPRKEDKIAPIVREHADKLLETLFPEQNRLNAQPPGTPEVPRPLAPSPDNSSLRL